ncbi:MAG: hypothetical protein WBP93_03770 [Pyrinomonadaceae bacterium]
MSKLKTIFQRLHLTTFALILALATVLGAVMWSSGAKSRQPQNIASQVVNRTQSLQLIRAERNSNSTALLLRNVSAKGIAAYTISVGEVKVEEDFVYSGNVIAPGDLYTANVPSTSPDAETKILSVIFDDKTGDGDPDAITATKKRRSAEKAQLTRILPLLHNILSLPDAKLMAALKNLKTQVASLPASSDEDSLEIRNGLNNGKEDVIQALRRFESKQGPQGINADNLRQELLRIQERTQSGIDKL